MAKPEEKPNDPPKEWTPDQPLEDADDEAEVQRRHRAQRRMKYLDEQAEASSKKPRGKPGERRSLFAV
jgi:hypothetical protein